MKPIIAFLFCVFIGQAIAAQPSNIIFHNVGEDKGIGSNICFSILKDRRGLIWVGTLNGLSRYDGYHFTNFKTGKDSNSIVDDRVLDICEDKEGDIWGSTSSGIFHYEVNRKKFVNYIPPTYDFARSVMNILCDKNNDIWATTEWNIVKLNKKTQQFEEFDPLTKSKDSLGAYSVRQNGLIEDAAGRGVWFATRTGLHFYDHATKKMLSHKNASQYEIFNRHFVTSLSISVDGNCWVFDNISQEAIRFDPRSFKILDRVSLFNIFQGEYVHTLKEDGQHRLWASGWATTMAVVDYKNGTHQLIKNSINNPLSIAGTHFWDLWEDKDNTVWISTTGGLSICNYVKNTYSIIPIMDRVPEFKNGLMGAFSIDPVDQSWWIASEGAAVGLINYFPSTGNYQYYDFSKATKNKAGLMPSPVFRVEFINGQPYACTHTGVWQLIKENKRMIPYEKSLEKGKDIFYQYVQQQGTDIWFVTAEGHYRWNTQTNETTKVKVAVDSLPDGQPYKYATIYFDENGVGWYVPAFGWLARIARDQKVTYQNYVKNKPKELSGYLTSIASDGKGNLWMASSGVGLYKYNTRTNEMTLYDQRMGITNFCNSAIIDRANRVWIAEGNKFSALNPQTNSMSRFTFPLYDNLMGYTNVQQMDSAGAIYSTFTRDVVKFQPDRLNLQPTLERPLISKIIVSGKERLINDEINLPLEPEENSLEFYFGSLISRQVFPYQFEYQLEGFDKNWIQAEPTGTALYNNLKPGTYLFKVRIVARDKSWNSAERTLELTIRMPFLQSTWFWTLVVVLILLALVLFYRYRLDRQRLILSLETKAQQLEKEKTMVMYDSLKQQLNPHFLFNSLTSLSGLIQTNQEVAGNFLEQMSGIYRYILKNGDNETVLLKSELEFVKLYIDLQKTRFKNGLIVNIDVPEDYMHYRIAPVTLQNLIENAIKHNIIDIESPLVIEIFIESDYLVVKNNLQKKNMVETSNKKGLVQFETLYRYLSSKPTIIEEANNSFIVKIPLI